MGAAVVILSMVLVDGVQTFSPSDEQRRVCAEKQVRLRSEFAEAMVEYGRCEGPQDCQVVQPGCPFGCFVAAASKHADDVSRLADEIRVRNEPGCVCKYRCVEAPPVSCLEGRCVLKTDADVRSQLRIENAEIDGKGILNLRCAFSFPTPRRIYSWRGELQPAIGHILFVDVTDDNGAKVEVEGAPGPLPLFPHRRDVAWRMRMVYDKPLRLVARPGSHELHGCFLVRLRYDSRKLEKRLRERAGLDAIALESKPVRVCSP